MMCSHIGLKKYSECFRFGLQSSKKADFRLPGQALFKLSDRFTERLQHILTSSLFWPSLEKDVFWAEQQ